VRRFRAGDESERGFEDTSRDRQRDRVVTDGPAEVLADLPPALVVLPASQPSGATNAPVDKIRYHSGWISIPRRCVRATALAPASNVAPPIVDNAAATLFERTANAAPATPAISAANTRSLTLGEANLVVRSMSHRQSHHVVHAQSGPL
jgi:hypothetical protein